jgi:hypothetical protein
MSSCRYVFCFSCIPRGGRVRHSASSTSITPVLTLFAQVRRWFDDHTASFFTLSARDRAVLDAQKPRKSAHEQLREAVMPSTKTPIEFFKENPLKLPKEEEEKKV